MKREDVKKFLLRHVEKLTFAAAIVVILVYLISLAITTSDAQREIARADEVMKELKERESKTIPPEIPSPKWHDQSKEQFDFVPKSESEINWFTSKQPYLRREVAIEPEPTRKHLLPQLTVEPGVYSVILKWEKNPDNFGITIVNYTIKRLLSTDPEEKAVVVKGGIPPEETTYPDKDVQPDEKYIYWIEELAKEDESHAKPLKEDEKLVSSERCEVTTKSNIDISRIMLDDYQRPTKANLTVTITKPDGSTVTDSTWVVRGEEIIVPDPKTKQETKSGWVAKEFGENEVQPGRRVTFVVIRNAKGIERPIER